MAGGFFAKRNEEFINLEPKYEENELGGYEANR